MRHRMSYGKDSRFGPVFVLLRAMAAFMAWCEAAFVRDRIDIVYDLRLTLY